MTETDDEAQRRREECERKARRGEMDPRLEFTFQLLIDGTALPRHQLMDYIFEGDMLDEINQLFLPNMKNKLLWFYQEVDEPEPSPIQDANKPGPSRSGGVSTSSKTPQGVSPSGANQKPKKLFLTDGWTCAFTGVCIYIFRINTSKQLPEEGFQKDLYCGVIDAKNIGLVTSIERIVEFVFMQALAFPSLEGDDEDVSCGLIKGQLLPGLRSFCSALRVCEQVCDHFNVFADGAGMFEKIDEVDEVRELAKNQDFCLQLEERVANWIKGIMKILGESEQLRKENDHSGPQDELEYWKKRGAQFSQLLAHLQEKEVQFTLHCLFLAGSRIMRHWKATDRKITFCYNEARDNSKFIQAMESCCHSLYLDDPVCMKESILSLLQTVRLIYSVSQFYNTSERTSALMVKITNQMIETCKSYITCRSKETIWSQDRNLIRTKLGNCIKLNHIYHETYYTVREQPFLPNQTPFGFSENFVFGKFDTFCDRLSKIISMFNLIDDYNHLFERRLEGLLLGEALEEASTAFEEAKKEILSKKYDYLDHRNSDFNDDFDRFIGKTDTLKDTIAMLIETNFDTVWETPQCIRFLIRFEKVSEKIPLSKMDDKYQRILKYCDKEIDRILKMFRKQRDDPPVPRNFPPISGRVRWSRALDCHLNELMMDIADHSVLQTLPLTKDLENKYRSVQGILIEYENEIVSIWLDQDVSVADACLLQPVLCLQGERLFVNLHATIPLLIREAKALAKLNVELPIVAATLMCRQSYFTTIQDSLNSLIKMFLSTVKAVKLEVRPLFLPQLVRLTAMLQPGLSTINWTHHNWTNFYERCKQAIETFEILVARVHDIYSNRILNVLMSMQDVSLQILPCDDEIWTVDEFLEKSEEACRQAAIELNRKSQMVSEAVEEVLSLVDKATVTFKEIAGNDVVTLFDAPPKDQQSSAKSNAEKESNQQQDWSILWSCFENPLSLLSTTESLPKGMQDMVCNAVVEMRRYYSRKVIDVLIKVIRAALDMIRRRVISEEDGAAVSKKPILALNAVLMIPHVTIKPSIDELQEMLITAGKNITGIAKGVAQWTSGRDSQLATNTVNPRVSRHQPDDKKGRRRKMYCLASEERPQMPHMLKSFYSSIMDNKEVVRALSLLSNCTKNIKPEIQAYIKRWKPYHFLWKNDRTTRQLMEFGLQEFESSLRCLAELDANLLVEPDIEVFGQCIAVYNEKLKYGLAIEIKSCNHKIGQAMKKKYKKEMDYVYAVINEMDRKLDRSIRDLDDVRMIMETLGKIREQEVDMEMRIDPIEEAFNVLTRYEVQVEREQFDLVDNLRSTFQNLQSCALQAQVKLLEMQPTFQDDLKTNLYNFKQDKIDYVNEYRNAGPMQPGLTPREASDRLILFQNRFEGMWRRLQTYQSGEELFGLKQTDYPELGQIRKELNLLQKLYKLYNDVIDRVSSYYDIPWNEVDIEEINNELMEFQNRCRKLPKGLKEWPAFHALKKTIDDFNDMCPLLELMANKAMKPRHWQRIMDVTKYIFEFDSEGFSLKNILEAPLLKHKEDIEDICISAMKEKDIEAKLKQVTNEWSVHELQFMSFNNRGELLLRGDTTAETIGQLEDSLMVLGSLLSNRYNAPFRKQIQQWVYDLSNSNEILERWLLVQNMWVYLEAVFVGGDIAKQLPKEAKRFSKIDKSWQKIMQRAHETPGVVACCVGDDLLKQLLPHLQEQLEICQKSLSGYLERKRMMFPRFFFVSDPALLEILGQASDSHTIQNHLLSIFDNTRHVRFHDIEYNKMMAIMSCEGEIIQLDRAIRAEGSVETWLTQLLVTAQQSLHSIIRTAYMTINDPNFALLAFLEKMPAQVGLLGIQMIWTRDAEMALMQARHERKVMSETNNKFLELLNTLIDQTTRNLTKIERTKFETLITIHVHQRDIFDILFRMNIKSANDFEWLKQSRFYFKEDLDKTWISITDVTFTYQNEYLGCTDRLVITPLTDSVQTLGFGPQYSPYSANGSVTDNVTPDMAHLVHPYWNQFPAMEPMWYKILACFLTIMGMISFCGNGVVVYIFSTTKSLRTPANLLVLNLAFSDFCMMATNCPMMTINLFFHTWILGPLMCDIYALCGSMFGCGSIWSMCMIALDRYQVIVKGVAGRPMTIKLAIMKIMAIWTFATFWTIMPMLGWSRYVPEGNLTSCGIEYLERDWNPRTYLIFYSIFVYYVPLFLICYSYWFIIAAVSAHEKAMREQAKKMNVKSLRSSEDADKSAEGKLAKVALVTISLWFMAWTPYLVINCMGLFKFEGLTPLNTIWGATFAKTSACYNPIVYGIRCYITLAQALTLSMGGSPCGPAGTGKTETVKDMGKTLAKYVVVFNCSDQMDYRGLGRIYKGLAQSGTWGCFDEFNRIELPVLSVAAQQVAVVLTAKKEKKKSFVFTDGDTIEMNPEFGIFITMNPGYAGRKELPENLKIQFRTVAMMVPDRQIIIRVKLASCGFLENITLARKFYTLYKLCEEQLTKQVHYDFGLRNILSVLRTLGASKRCNSKDSESTIVMRVLRDMNLSKLIDEDEPLFMSLVSDLFPNQTLEKTNYPELEAAIAQQADEAGLVYHPPWVLKLIQLYETQKVRHGIMTLGPSGAGKTTCIHTLMKAMTQMGTVHREMRMNPKAITSAQMFGRLDVATNDWTDGIFSALWRKTLKSKSGENIWLVLDGPVDSIWIENLNSVLDDNKTLTLANGDRLVMAPTCKIIFEPHNIDNASPATVSRNGMVYMSSSGLDWKPIVQAWLKARSPGEKTVFSDLFEQSFLSIFNWGTQNLKLLMTVLQCNIVQQMLFILEGLVPVKKDDENAVSLSSKESQDGKTAAVAGQATQSSAEKAISKETRRSSNASEGEEILEEVKTDEKEDTCSPEHLHRLYIFSIAWGLGGYLSSADRCKLDAYVKETFSQLDYPKMKGQDSTIFDFFVSPTGVWQSWKTLVTPYMYPEVSTPDYLSILVPIVDNVRIDYLIGTIANQERAVMLIGEQGTGKTVMMKNFMKKMNPESYMGRSFNFSSATSPYQFQRTIESYVEKRVGVTFGPPGGRKLIVFIDDINLPEINQWGDQITNEIVRQTMDMKGFYSLEKPGDFTTVVDVQYVGAMGLPGGGRNDIPSRLKRQFSVFNCNIPDNESIDKIFRVVGEGHYNAKRGFTTEVRNLVKKLIFITRFIWQRTREKLLPTPAKFHYVFSLRDLSRIWQGMVGTLSTVITSESVLMSLWKHECTRVFADRFTTFQDKDWFSSELASLVKEELSDGHVEMIVPSPVFVDFMRDAPEPTGEEGEDTDMELPKVYEPVCSHEILRERLVMFLAQFNEMVRGSGMDLVFFPDAMLHLVKISRIIRHPRGNVMLVGVGGSGKQSLTKLASFIAGYKTFQISLTRSYNVANFLEDLKLLYRTCGVQGKGTTFLFSDLDIKEEGFLEYLNNILSSGVISNLFTRDEQAEIVQELTPVMKRENQRKTATPESVMEFFLQRTCSNLHVAFCFSPVGETFRARVQRFPALVSGCTIDWFQPWPKDALVSVAKHFLSDFEIECTPAVKEELVTALGSIQDVVAQTSLEYFQRFRRATHVTPKSYLNFIAGYKNIYQQKQKELGDGVEKMDTGLEKLKEASASVEILKKDLAVMEQELVEASKKAESVLVEVTERAMQAEIVKNQVMIVKEKAEALVACIANEKALAEEKLEAAKPALEEAENALNTIKPAHIATVRKLGRPPHLIMRIMDCVLILFKRKLHPCIADSGTPCPKPSWQESLKMMASATFLLQLQNYPKDTINDEMIDLLQPYFRMEDYNMDMARRVCGDVAGLLSWTKAMGFFHSVNKEVLPLKANLTMQEARLKLAMEDLAGAEEQLREREEALQQVKNQYDKAVGEKQRLTDAANVCLRKMTAATALINGLTDEKHRWTNQSKEFKIQLGKLVGDVLLATGFLSYCGPYNQEFRANLIKTWMTILKQREIPFTLSLNITSMLVDSSTVSEWTLQGLPNDELSVQNALIATKSSSYPLLVDPQSQGKIWIKCKEDRNELQITSLNHKYFRTHLEDSLSLGRPLLIEDVGTELDPVIDNVLEKNFIKSGSIEKVLVGDKECDVMPGFMLYITTKLPNPAFSPEISAKTSIIDFTVTMRGLEDQLLGRVILMEKSDLEAERVALFETVMQNQRNMKELEANLLYRLSSSQGSLVDDEALIEVLQVTKSTAEEVNQKLKISEITEKKIMKAREEYRAVAARGSILYFLIVEMSNVNVMYQNSLKQFLVIFNNSITKSTKSSVTEERINIILRYLTYEVWAFTNRSLYERHKQLFTLMLAIKIDFHKGNITHEEFMAFIKGGASLDLNAVAPKPFRWILDITWLNLVEISKLETFANVLQIIEANEKDWRMWYEAEKPEMEDIPCGYHSSLDGFRKLLLVRSWSPDRTISQAKKYIEESLGQEYSEMQILDLEATWLESEPRTPFVCLLSIGSDPTTQIGLLAKQKGILLKSVSMGQGQEFHARKMIQEAMATGGWVLLQNVHLSLPFCSEVIDMLVETEHIDGSFRMWVTTEPHSEFPIGLLQMAIKFTNEPPQGIRASMKRSYQAFSQDFLDYTSAPQWPPLLYTVAFLHTVIQERRKFGPLGWNVPYEFNQADFAASVQFIQNHLDEMDPKKGVSWQTVCYMLGEVQYGGRVTDDFDKRLLTTFTAVWFCETLLTSAFEFYKGYRVPSTKSLQGFIDYINSLPANDTPEVFGLHPNADITYQINTAKGILDTILSVQPKEGGNTGGETRESIVYQLADDMLRKLPPQYNEFEVRENLTRMGALLPMNIFLRQEIDRMQRVIKTVFSCLRDLKLAIDGTIVMSPSLKESLDAMYDARIPEPWMKISWESTTLGFWYTELLERNAQFRTWISTDRPKVFWMTGFFNPQGFLTAMRQEVTRAHKGWALDSVVLQNQTTRYNKEDITDYPLEGVYVHGLFLEGASMDRRSGKLIESKPKVLYEQMPVIYIYAINTTAGKDPKLYECPIYRKPQRTDTKYVGSIDFETDLNPKHWTLRGVALLCDIK